jgi:hypothetical protein
MWQMSRVLIRCRNIEIGDILFASSIAKKLKEENPEYSVDFDLNYLQPIELLQNNPYIDNVYYKESVGPYDETFELTDDPRTLDPYKSAVSQFQQMCNIKDPDDTFEIFTNTSEDYAIGRSMGELINIGEWQPNFIKVCYVMDWERKSYLLSEEEDELAPGSPTGTGSGRSPRKLDDILKPLYKPNIMLFAIGIESKLSKAFPSINSSSKFSFTASLIKNSNYVIGPEGCLTNMSSALGVPTIITTDYIHQLITSKGLEWPQDEAANLNNLKCRPPFLGPCQYFPKANHVHLNPFLSDTKVGEKILEIVTDGR